MEGKTADRPESSIPLSQCRLSSRFSGVPPLHHNSAELPGGSLILSVIMEICATRYSGFFLSSLKIINDFGSRCFKFRITDDLNSIVTGLFLQQFFNQPLVWDIKSIQSNFIFFVRTGLPCIDGEMIPLFKGPQFTFSFWR